MSGDHEMVMDMVSIMGAVRPVHWWSADGESWGWDSHSSPTTPAPLPRHFRLGLATVMTADSSWEQLWQLRMTPGHVDTLGHCNNNCDNSHVREEGWVMIITAILSYSEHKSKNIVFQASIYTFYNLNNIKWAVQSVLVLIRIQFQSWLQNIGVFHEETIDGGWTFLNVYYFTQRPNINPLLAFDKK